jgi:D-galactose 1-dehydrogenase/L-arabinose 1- dehydrogenase
MPSPLPPYRLAVVGLGKIARDRHLPAIAARPQFQLAATADPANGLPGVPAFASLDALLAAGLSLDAVALCTPPAVRARLATLALEAGLNVLLEKPPAATLGEASAMASLAHRRRRTLLTTWHAREAAGVEPARRWLRGRNILDVRVEWREDINHWHPGQDWLLDAGGFGVFDPGINALSILTRILPGPLTVESARLAIPKGREAPIAAEASLAHGAAPVTLALDFQHPGTPFWTIEVETDAGLLRLDRGGRRITHPGRPLRDPPAALADRAYGRLYDRFARLIPTGRSAVDLEPLRLVADIFLRAHRRPAPPFDWSPKG